MRVVGDPICTRIRMWGEEQHQIVRVDDENCMPRELLVYPYVYR